MIRCGYKKNKAGESGLKGVSRFFSVYLLLLSLVQVHCTPGPEPINFGHDQCIRCKMIISDLRYGSELVTTKAKVYKFDSVECLASYLHENNIVNEDIHSLWVIDFIAPQNLIDAKTAAYLHSAQLASPMGLNLTALASVSSAEELSRKYPGTIIEWQNVESMVNQTWLKKGR